jgi:hypothetical protein
MRIYLYPGFATYEEINLLNNWVELGVKQKWLDLGISKGVQCTNRLTSRFYGDRFEYPEAAYTLYNRINKTLGLDAYPPILGHGKNGIVVSYTMNGGDVYKHKDPKSAAGLATLRCNILTQKPDAGCQLYIEGHPIKLNVGDLHCYLASEHEHWATPVEGDTPRIMWMFGAHVPADDWNNNIIRMKNVG